MKLLFISLTFYLIIHIIKTLTYFHRTKFTYWVLLNENIQLMASLAEYERELIRERTNAGLQSARARGRLGGRPKGYTAATISKLLLLRSIYKDPTLRPEEIYKPFGLTRATF